MRSSEFQIVNEPIKMLSQFNAIVYVFLYNRAEWYHERKSSYFIKIISIAYICSHWILEAEKYQFIERNLITTIFKDLFHHSNDTLRVLMCYSERLDYLYQYYDVQAGLFYNEKTQGDIASSKLQVEYVEQLYRHFIQLFQLVFKFTPQGEQHRILRRLGSNQPPAAMNTCTLMPPLKVKQETMLGIFPAHSDHSFLASIYIPWGDILALFKKIMSDQKCQARHRMLSMCFKKELESRVECRKKRPDTFETKERKDTRKRRAVNVLSSEIDALRQNKNRKEGMTDDLLDFEFDHDMAVAIKKTLEVNKKVAKFKKHRINNDKSDENYGGIEAEGLDHLIGLADESLVSGRGLNLDVFFEQTNVNLIDASILFSSQAQVINDFMTVAHPITQALFPPSPVIISEIIDYVIHLNRLVLEKHLSIQEYELDIDDPMDREKLNELSQYNIKFKADILSHSESGCDDIATVKKDIENIQFCINDIGALNRIQVFVDLINKIVTDMDSMICESSSAVMDVKTLHGRVKEKYKDCIISILSVIYEQSAYGEKRELLSAFHEYVYDKIFRQIHVLIERGMRDDVPSKLICFALAEFISQVFHDFKSLMTVTIQRKDLSDVNGGHAGIDCEVECLSDSSDVINSEEKLLVARTLLDLFSTQAPCADRFSDQAMKNEVQSECVGDDDSLAGFDCFGL